MNTQIIRNTLLALVLSPIALACGGELPEGADEASTQDDITIGPVSTCLTQVADATMTLGPDANNHYFAHVDSAGTAYNGGLCSSFIVDVVAPGGYNVPGPLVENAFTLSGSHQGITLNQYNCDNAYERMRIYRKSSNILTGATSDWELLVNDTVESGSWLSDPDAGSWCQLTGQWFYSGYRFEAPISIFTRHTYRVLFLPELYDAPTAARVSWQWAY